MDKIRWVVVVSPKSGGSPGSCVVVPLSTTAPDRSDSRHVRLDRDPAPDASGAAVWVKCDMLMTVSFARLSAYWSGRRPDGKRNYLSLHVSAAELGKIRRSLLSVLGMGGLIAPDETRMIDMSQAHVRASSLPHEGQPVPGTR